METPSILTDPKTDQKLPADSNLSLLEPAECRRPCYPLFDAEACKNPEYETLVSVSLHPAAMLSFAFYGEHLVKASLMARGANNWLREFIKFRRLVLEGHVSQADKERCPVRITVIDTGVDASHPCLKQRQWVGQRRLTKESLFCDFSGMSCENDQPCATANPIDEYGAWDLHRRIIAQIGTRY